MATLTTPQGGVLRTERKTGIARLLELWQAQPLPGRGARFGFGAFLVALCFLPFLAGPLMQYTYAHDAFIFLDGGWRVLHNQRPQIDFSTNLGPVMFLYTAAGILLTRGGGHALQLAHGLLGLTVAVPVYLICFRRLKQVPGILLCVLIVIVAMAPYNTGEFPLFLTSGMLYNRVGYALVGVILVEALVPPKPQTHREEFWGGIVTGVLLSLLLLMKITYFIAAAVIVVMLWLCRPQDRSRAVGLVAASVACLLLGLGYLRFDFPTLIAEYSMSAGGKELVPSAIIWLFLLNLQPSLFLLVLASASAMLSDAFDKRRGWWRFPWAVAVTAGAEFIILISNHQLTGNPLSAFLGIVIAGQIVWIAAKRGSFSDLQLVRVAIALGLLVPAFSMAMPTTAAYMFSVLKSGIHWKGSTPEVPIQASALTDMTIREEPPFFDGTGKIIAKGYGSYINDGFDLLKRYTSPAESVMSLDFSNPFSFGLQRPPQRGGTTCLQAGVTFNTKHSIPPSRLFGDVKVVMLPKWFSDGSIAKPIEKLYGPTIRSQFRKVAESNYWILLRRAS